MQSDYRETLETKPEVTRGKEGLLCTLSRSPTRRDVCFLQACGQDQIQKVVLFSHGLTLWVNDKVWELVTYCTGALLDCVYILNYY